MRKKPIKITKELQDKFKELYLKGESSITISKRLGISPRAIQNNLKKMGIIRNKSEANKVAIKVGRAKAPTPKQHDIPPSAKDLTQEKAYILGTLCGDGYLYKGAKGKTVSLQSTDKEFAEEFSNCLYKTYKLKPKNSLIRSKNPKWKDRYQSLLCSKRVVEDLEKYHKNFRTFEWRVPKEIFSSYKDIKAKFLQSFFDSEGYVGNKKIIGASANPLGLKEIKMLLEDFGIRPKIYKYKARKTLLIYIQDRNSLEKFQESINFIINRKRENLKRLVSNYKRYNKLSSDIDKLIEEMISLRKKGMSYAKIGKELNISHSVIWNRINEVKI